MSAFLVPARSARAARGPVPDVDTATPAVVLKLGDNPFDHGGLGAARSLGRLGVPVYAVDRSAGTPPLASRYVRGRWVWQPNVDDTDQVREGLMRLAERIGRPSVLVPTDDLSAVFLAEEGAGLRPYFLFPDQPPDLPRRVIDKYTLFSLCRDLDVPCVATELVRSVEEAEEFAARVGFPLLVKVRVPWHSPDRGPVRRTTIVCSGPELAAVFTHVSAEDGMLVQEHIPGGAGHDWFFHGYCDGASRCRPAFTGVKERSYPAHAGPTALGRAATNPELVAEVRDLLARLSYRGILDIDIRLDPRDNRYKLLDFNPRLGAQSRVFRDSAGVDVAVAAHLDLTGRPVPPVDQIDGRVFLVENYDVPASFDYWRRGELDPRRWLSSVRDVDELAWFAWDDLRPFGLMCRRVGGRAGRRMLARYGRARQPFAPHQLTAE
ncbi:carboxylate--amine ligase [Nocardioides xinjiangensis]|uniref:carboxylate--amine ligase n=1 Tax=Nocardioides xinjiangensis TaxID=2817376 RepID=UPI001B301846|nr:hypothetical protein [Nocardioides sp. SYSU D00514]